MALIQTTISQLRNTQTLSTADRYYTTDIGQEGFWEYLGTDTSTIDNTGLVLTQPQYPTFGATRSILKRVYDGPICASWFGIKGDGITWNTDAFQNAINTVVEISGGVLFFGHGTFLTSTVYIPNSTLTNKDKIQIQGSGRMSTIIKV